MASILGGKKKGKKSKATTPEPKDADLLKIKTVSVENEQSGSQVSVREAQEENTADNITNKQNEAEVILDEEIDLKDAPPKGKKKAKGAAKAQNKGDNPGLVKPAWRGKSLEKEHYDSGKKSFVKSSSLSTSGRGRNAVEPVEKGSGSVSGSSASLLSSSSLREAWSDDNASESAKSTKKEKKGDSTVSLSKADKNERNSLDGDTTSIHSEQSIVKATPGQSDQHAYIPYIYARDCIARITNDMTSMKANHVRIVREIETNYHQVEDETQSQFNTFILLLRTEYSGKVKTFRQVIETHRQELEQKEEYWNKTLTSLSERNSQLLSDKKALLIKNKLEIDKLEEEKQSALGALTHKLDAAESATVSLDRERKEELERTRLDQANEHVIVINRLEEEKKILEEQLESEKSAVKNLQQQFGERPVTSGTVTQVTSPSGGNTSATNVALEETTVGVVSVSDADQSLITDERQKMAEERKRMEEERTKMMAERESFINEREEMNLDRETLRSNITDSRKESAELLAKYNIVCGQAEDVERLSAAYKTLEEQYNVLASVTTAAALNTGDSQKRTQESLKTAEAEVVMMKEAKSNTDKDIEKWEKEFQKANGRPPTEGDKSDSVKEMYTSREEVNLMLDSLERKKETLQQLQSGTVPTVKPVPQSTVASSEPVITTVQVEVPDPKVVKALEESQALVAELRAEISSLNSENTTLQVETTDLREELEQAHQEMELIRESGVSASIEDSDEQLSALKLEITTLENKLLEERSTHDQTCAELDTLASQLRAVREDESTKILNLTTELEMIKSTTQADLKAKEEIIQSQKARLEELEKERLSKLPPDTAKEIKNLQAKIALLEKEKLSSGSTAASSAAKLKEAQTKLEAATTSLETARASNRELEGKLKKFQGEKEKALRELTNQLEKKEQQRVVAEKSLANLQTKLKSAESGGTKEKTTGSTKAGAAGAGVSDSNLKRENVELKRRIKELEAELKRTGKASAVAGAGGDSAASDRQTMKKQEKILKELEKKFDFEVKKREKHEQNLKIKEEELTSLQKENDANKRELTAAREELSALGVSAQQGAEAAAKVKTLEAEVKSLTEENKTLTDNFNSERVLRKKYYNMVEDMKGKIRVYCRSRPLSKSEVESGNYEVIKSPDEYSIQVESSRGLKEFQFDQIFLPDSSQDKIFEDTNNLIQSAVDGYNVCIFAYGQTGSGKTFTMIGDRAQNFPGIAPRAFERIFEILAENDSKYSFSVSTYMLELYNDHLLDLYGKTDEDKLDIRKDKQGMVFVQGAAVKQAKNAKELFALFEEGSKNRHVASTKMNAESSRSHLVLAIVIESTNKATGQVTKGKLSLVDLAGSERVGKTGASAEQLKEAMSINKSLSALGDVISALSSEQTFIPYRNNKLTMLMQDSLGGNAKTLMFVNISPANYNCDESIISLTYASRVKLITNSAQKNSDNKEIARLKDIINKLKQGEQVDEEI